MRLAISGSGYATAADEMATANQVVALAAGSLSGKLSGCAAMAGDDATSHDFASAYDAAAQQALDTLATLTDSLAALSGLLVASAQNHEGAEAANAGRADPPQISAPKVRSFVPNSLPGAAGDSPPSLDYFKGWILDQVQGFVWPSADTDRLRDAAQHWRHAATAVDDLPAYLRIATGLLDQELSPEVPLALDALAEIDGLIFDVHSDLLRLAQSCDDYADQVEAAHQALHAVLDEILSMVVEGAVISGLLAGFSGGLAALGGASVVTAKVAAKAPRLHAILTALAATAGATAGTVRTTTQGLTHAQTKLTKFARARMKLRDERGSIVFTSVRQIKKKLWQHEASGGHTMRKHVDMPHDELAQRARDEGLAFASTYRSVAEAEAHIGRAFKKHSDDVRDWVASSKKTLRLDVELGSPTGVSVDPAGVVHEVTGLRLFLRRNPTDPSDWYIHTSFPQP